MDKKEMQQLLLEQEKRLGKKFNGIDKKFDNIDKKFIEQEKRIGKRFDDRSQFLLEQFQHEISIIAETQSEHSKQLKKIDHIEEMVAQNTVDIDIMKGMLRRKVDVDEFETLEKRVIVLEKKMRVG